MSIVAKSTTPSDAVSCPMPAKNRLNPQGLKPCCACPETKSLRDDCFLRYDPDEAPAKCADVLQKHIVCMRSYGFDV